MVTLPLAPRFILFEILELLLKVPLLLTLVLLRFVVLQDATVVSFLFVVPILVEFQIDFLSQLVSVADELASGVLLADDEWQVSLAAGLRASGPAASSAVAPVAAVFQCFEGDLEGCFQVSDLSLQVAHLFGNLGVRCGVGALQRFLQGDVDHILDALLCLGVKLPKNFTHVLFEGGFDVFQRPGPRGLAN